MICTLLSGEHPTLPKAEIKAILESEKISFKIINLAERIIRIETVNKGAEIINNRAAYTRFSFIELLLCSISKKEIIRNVEELEIEKYISHEESIAVRIKRIGRKVRINTPQLERMIGEILIKKSGCKVNLKKPNRLLLGLLTDEEFIFGLSAGLLEEKKFGQRTPRKKPFFHPSSLQPKLARCLVNLSRATKYEALFDPFCGTGTILIEAGLMGIECIGGELKEKMIKGAKRNLEHYRIDNANLILSDALCFPVTNFGAIATDPPYGRTASTCGISMPSLIQRFLKNASDALPKNGFLCISSPKDNKTVNTAENYSFKVQEIHSVYVHRSLTREIAVLKIE